MSCTGPYFSDDKGTCVPCLAHCLYCDSSDECLRCESGYWGKVCEYQCSACQKRTDCQKKDGYCRVGCRDGYSGILCDTLCDKNCSSCDRTDTYNCLKCALGRYPLESCHRICSKCNNMACDDDGNCTSGCVKGYWGNNCESACSEHCLDKSCHQESGTCTHGCEGEYTGPRCLNGKETSPTIFVFVGIGFALIGLTVVVVTVVCIRRERQKHTWSKRPAETRFADPEQRGKDAETTPFINASYVGGGQVLLTTVPERMHKLQTLLESIKQRTEEDFQSEFEKLPNLLNKDASSDARREVLPFKENAVFVKGKKVEAYTTNASLITDMPCAVKYIASGGPNNEVHSGFTQFWMMLWQLKCQTVVMFYNINENKKSSEQYWPNRNKIYGDWEVRGKEYKSVHKQKYITRTFEIFPKKQKQDALCVKLLHYYKWPGKGIADNIQRLLDFRKEVNHARQTDSGPLVVLCRNGAGRTGTYLALDMLLNLVDDMIDNVNVAQTKDIDVFACVMHLRKQRMNMVESVEQYKFLYQALFYYISGVLKDMNRQEAHIQEDNLKRQFEQEAEV